MKKKPITIQLEEYPKELHPFLSKTDIYDSSCSSNAQVLYLSPDRYLKIDETGELATEAALTGYFHGRGLGVEVLYYISADRDYMVTRAADGQDLTHYLDEPEYLCQVMAETLRHLHIQPIVQMPVSLRHERYLDSAAGPADGGYYDRSVLMDRFPVRSQAEAWQIMQENKHLLQADTLIHGDYCLPNIVLSSPQSALNETRLQTHQDVRTTLIDLALAGAGDRHIDLYWAIWSLQYNLKTDAYTDYFLDCYGRENFDYNMLRVIAAFEVFG